ncbi:MAG TPA: glycerophosphodiester phosphodiesterase [Thermoanaerobaculia bacterium]|nr:glycerophosphodiester phosphodiesterase [Thermoanaerobaculia bacterium]
MNEWRKPHPVWIVGHRGAPRRARENTIASFDWAETFGADAIEFDLRQTREGEAVVFHDEDIALGNQRIPLRHFTVREIEKLTLSSEFGEYKVPKLEEVFHRYGRALRYVVEVKVSHGTNLALMARRVSKVAAAYRVTDRCLVASFDADFLRKMREIDPDIATSFLFDRPVALPEPGRPTPLFPTVDAIGPRRDLVAPALLAQATAAGLSVHVWTVDEMEEVAKLISAGVASITTNAPDVALRMRDGEGRQEKHLALRPEITAEPVN